MDRIGQVAAIGMATTTGTALIQEEKRLDFLDIDISFGLLPFNLPIGNVVVLLGFCFSAYAFYRARQYAKQKQRRKEDNWIDTVVKDPDN
jgi:hypothetical protein